MYINIIKDNINNIKTKHYKINIFQKPLLNDIFVSLNNEFHYDAKFVTRTLSLCNYVKKKS